MKSVALLICGALGKEVKTIVDEHGWDLDIYGVPAMHHFYPKKIVDAVERRLEQLSGRYRRVVVVYGDCGTAGALDPVLERHGAVTIMRLNRPDQLNAWDWQMSREMQHAYAALDEDDSVRAIVVTGAGRAFCAGASLAPSGETFDGTRKRDEFDDRYPGPSKNATELATPVIAAINGPAVGAGMTLAMSADIRVVAEDAKLGFVFNRRGRGFDDAERDALELIRPHLGNLYRLCAALGRAGWAPAQAWQLTPREQDVLRWLSAGKTDRDIGAILAISPRTVHKHLQRIYEKLGVEGRAALAQALKGAPGPPSVR